ncbi:hypothetical protein VTJ04DRAFT_8228 [Mycothermus thermophilus]|uniref:uncharacterized protein n=1 Tax=Humicola insolens TaxID=85995 RepID=UPI0037442646
MALPPSISTSSSLPSFSLSFFPSSTLCALCDPGSQPVGDHLPVAICHPHLYTHHLPYSLIFSLSLLSTPLLSSRKSVSRTTTPAH